MSKSELIECMYFETEHRPAATVVSVIVGGCCRDFPRYTVSEQPLLCSDIFCVYVCVCVCVNFRKFIKFLMFRKPMSVACLLSAARVNRQLILTRVHVSDSVCMCTVYCF